MSSRLFQNIREKLGLCYYIGARHSAGTYDGLFMIRAGIDKKRFDSGLEKIYEEIEHLVTHGVSEQEVTNAKSYIIGKLQMGIESSDEMAEFIGSDYLLYQEINNIDEIIHAYESVTLNQVQELLPLLQRENLYLYYIK